MTTGTLNILAITAILLVLPVCFLIVRKQPLPAGIRIINFITLATAMIALVCMTWGIIALLLSVRDNNC